MCELSFEIVVLWC